MNLLVDRFESGDDYTISNLHINSFKECMGVEDEYRKVKVHGETRIPEGIYKLSSRVSPKFSKHFYSHPTEYTLVPADVYLKTPSKYSGYIPHELIWVKDTPNFEYILIHWGNTDDDSHGCYIVGTARAIINGQVGVSASKLAYMKMYPKVMKAIKSGEVCTIEYKVTPNKMIA